MPLSVMPLLYHDMDQVYIDPPFCECPKTCWRTSCQCPCRSDVVRWTNQAGQQSCDADQPHEARLKIKTIGQINQHSFLLTKFAGKTLKVKKKHKKIVYAILAGWCSYMNKIDRILNWDRWNCLPMLEEDQSRQIKEIVWKTAFCLWEISQFLIEVQSNFILNEWGE